MPFSPHGQGHTKDMVNWAGGVGWGGRRSHLLKHHFP